MTLGGCGLAWIILGGLIGYAASQRRHYSPVAGFLGGALLGPFSFLMYAVSGISRGDKRRKCPHCAELIKVEAKVCPHCQRDLPTGGAA